jgi:hypothetical protein
LVATTAEDRLSTFVVQKIIGTYDLLRIAKSKTRNQPAKGPEDGGPNIQKWKAAIAVFAASVSAGDVGGRSDVKCQKHRLGDLRSRTSDLAFWLLECGPRASIRLEDRHAAVDL